MDLRGAITVKAGVQMKKNCGIRLCKTCVFRANHHGVQRRLFITFIQKI